MRATWYTVRAEARSRRVALLGLVLLAGLVGGVVLASASGARRTSTAYDRFLEQSNAGHLLVSRDTGYGGYELIREVEGVDGVAPIIGLELFPDIDADVPDVLNIGSIDGTYGYQIDRPNVLTGRLPAPERTDEMLVSRSFVEAFGLEVGDRIEMVAEADDETTSSRPPAFPVTIVGVGVFSTDVVPTTDLDALPTTLLPPALTEAVTSRIDVAAFDGASILLRDGANGEEVMSEAAERMGLDTLFVVARTTTQATVERAIRPQATAMWAFAVIVGVAAVLVVSQTVARHAALVISQSSALVALGVRRREHVQQAALLHAIVGASAALVAVVVAVAASPLFPIGRARAAEHDPGVAANLALLGAGMAVLLLLVAVSAAAAAWVVTRPGARRSARPSLLAGVVVAAGAPPRVVIGVRRALEAGSGSAKVPVRSGLLGAALAVAAVIATATFATSLDALVTQPARYGQTWTTSFDSQFAPAPAGDLLERFGDDPRVTGMAGIAYNEVRVLDDFVPVIAFERLAGDLEPTIVEGRAPSAPGEVALGALTSRNAGSEIGDELSVETQAGPARWTVVGIVVFPQLSLGSFTALGLGVGALVDASTLPSQFDRAALAEAIDAGELPPGTTLDEFLVGDHAFNAVLFATDPSAAPGLAAELRQHPQAVFARVRLDQRPAAISTYADVRSTPVVLSILLACFGAGLVGHVLLTAVLRRRKELAVCRVVGMSRRDVLTIVRWQATTLAVVAGLIGVPLGLAGGRGAWRLLSEDLGIPPDASIAWGWIVIAALATLIVANAAAAVPGWRASRARPATVLRAE